MRGTDGYREGHTTGSTHLPLAGHARLCAGCSTTLCRAGAGAAHPSRAPPALLPPPAPLPLQAGPEAARAPGHPAERERAPAPAVQPAAEAAAAARRHGHGHARPWPGAHPAHLLAGPRRRGRPAGAPPPAGRPDPQRSCSCSQAVGALAAPQPHATGVPACPGQPVRRRPIIIIISMRRGCRRACMARGPAPAAARQATRCGCRCRAPARHTCRPCPAGQRRRAPGDAVPATHSSSRQRSRPASRPAMHAPVCPLPALLDPAGPCSTLP